jgi:hypothetical protein
MEEPLRDENVTAAGCGTSRAPDWGKKIAAQSNPLRLRGEW